MITFLTVINIVMVLYKQKFDAKKRQIVKIIFNVSLGSQD